MESTVAIELYRRTCSEPALDLFYWTEQGVGEVDFVLVRGGEAEALVQSCYALGDDDTRERELRALARAAEELDCHDLTMITWDEDGSLTIAGETVRLISLWKWLLANTK